MMFSHGIERTMERAGLSKKAAMKMIYKAQALGKTSQEMPSTERKYMQRKEKFGANVLYYSGYCFLYSDNGSCITMYKAPSWFEKSSKYYGKERIKNIKKYYKYNRILLVEG